jgi:sugar-specific transcriptional regulator TrmB
VLNKLGFTESEAKIYAVMYKLGKSRTNTVAKIAHVDRAQTYRTVIKLEKKGVLQKVLGRPVEYKAIPIDHLLSIMFEKKRDEIAQVEKQASQLLQRSSNEQEPLEKDEYIEVAPRAEMIWQEIKQDIRKVKRSHDSLWSIRMWQEIGIGSRENLTKLLLERGVKVTVIVEKPNQENTLPPQITELRKYPNYNLRFLPSISEVFMVIHDDEKVWIKTSNESYFESSWLVSNNRQILRFARSLFDKIKADSVEG